MQPVLVACSHGTASPAGKSAVAGLVRAVSERRPGLEVREAFVDVQHPTPAEVLADLDGRPARIVPLLLSAGYHVFVDLARAVGDTPSAALARALGPDGRLATLLHARLGELGLEPGDRVVLAAAGSSEPSALADCETVATALASLIGRPVQVAYLSSATPTVASAVATLRESPGRVLVATYLLAPGFFADLATRCGADAVTDPLLRPDEQPHEALVDIVLDRYDDRAGPDTGARR